MALLDIPMLNYGTLLPLAQNCLGLLSTEETSATINKPAEST